ncbi:FAD-dependent monooxygenase, partial [Dactylosporangium sp. NPDC005572]|uniref:FAD-dependent oxidoreductase n=1 Tax=Dactylosporangium sp. NPDC005572 TaxID=3156889 RepID=UPI0033B4401C
MNTRSDVVIVGARAAGAATALLLARLGHDVVVLDRAVFPADTLSTHQIARTGVVQLHRWGLLDAVLGSGAPAIRRVSFTAAGETVARTVKDKAGVDLLVAPRRQVLDTLLAEAAARAGARIRFGVTATGLRRDGTGRVVAVTGHDRRGDPVRCDGRFVVGADGLRSMVAREAGAAVVEEHAAGGAVQYAYYDGVAWDGIELIVADRALTGVFPTHDGAACVWICGPSADAHRARRARPSRAEAFTAYLRRTAPELAHRLERGRRVSPVTGMLRTPNVGRAAPGPRGARGGRKSPPLNTSHTRRELVCGRVVGICW